MCITSRKNAKHQKNRFEFSGQKLSIVQSVHNLSQIGTTIHIMKVSYPGIVSIGFLFADNLPANTAYSALAGIPVNLFLRATDVPLSGKAVCVVEQSNDSNGSAESLTLSFSSSYRLPRHRAVAFVVKDANNQSWLIGQLERPHLSITSSQQTGTPDGDSAVFVYEVKQIAPICYKPCKVMV